jgi:N-methylhydantoinase A
MSYRLGIDIGGTFTDFCVLDESSGKTVIAKMPSTPSHPSRAVIAGLDYLSQRHNVSQTEIEYFVHGTTIGVNTLLERKGARTGLLVTNGFRDIMTLGRSRLPDIFDLLVEKPAPLIGPRYVREIDERMLHDGEVLKPLDLAEVVRATGELIDLGIEALTITFLHSYRNPAHESAAKAAIQQRFPDLYVSTSSEIWPQIREYERTLASAVNAYVGRKMGDYFSALQEEVVAGGLSATLLSTKSNGGVMTARSARTMPVETLSSGPASGAIGAHFIGRVSGFERLIPLDMGGTSTEVAIIDGSIRYTNSCQIGDFDVVMPAVDLSSIGAGGGSIAWTDSAGVLKVGPESSGSEPGPACYGRGGVRPTITDAYVAMGVLDPDRFLGGELKLDRGAALRAVESLCADLELSIMATAEAILRVATSNMYSKLVPLMARKGIDVTDFALLCYGGAGPTHGFLLAREVGIRKVLVPPSPGALCALGALVADVKSDFILTLHRSLEPEYATATIEAMRQAYATLDRRALAWISDEKINVVDSSVVHSADMRYSGQSFEVTVDLTAVDLTAPGAMLQLRSTFDRTYRSLYGHDDPNAALEIINLRATAVGATPKPDMPRLRTQPLTDAAAVPTADRQRQIFIDDKSMVASVYNRDSLTWGHVFDGPAIIEQYDSTTFVPPGFRCTVDAFGMIVGELQ